MMEFTTWILKVAKLEALWETSIKFFEVGVFDCYLFRTFFKAPSYQTLSHRDTAAAFFPIVTSHFILSHHLIDSLKRTFQMFDGFFIFILVIQAFITFKTLRSSLVFKLLDDVTASYYLLCEKILTSF